MPITWKLAIRGRIARLGDLDYDHDGSGGLPIRPDVARHAAADLFADEGGISESLLSRVDEFEVSLHPDGTITVTLASGGRTLFLDVLCGGVVTYVEAFEDGATTIEGVIRTGDPSDVGEIDDLIRWLIRE